MSIPNNRLARDPFLATLLAGTDLMTYLPDISDGNGVRDGLRELFPSASIISLFNDAACRERLARDFTVVSLFSGDRFLANEYLQFSGRYTGGMPQGEYASQSPENLLRVCHAVKVCEQAVLAFYLNL